MKKDYFTIEEGKELNSIQNLYFTHTTIMKNLIDSNTYDKMMVDVCNDIYHKDEILEDIKGLRRKQRLFLCKIIYPWAKMNWSSNHLLPRSSYTPSSFFSTVKIIRDSKKIFMDRLEQAFSEEVVDICQYEMKARQLNFKIEKKGNVFNIIMCENIENHYFYDVFGRMVVKYDETKNKLHISYIENITWNNSYKSRLSTPQTYRIELFKGVRKILKNIYKSTGELPNITCNKKYRELFKKAINKGYLDIKEETNG